MYVTVDLLKPLAATLGVQKFHCHRVHNHHVLKSLEVILQYFGTMWKEFFRKIAYVDQFKQGVCKHYKVTSTPAL
jgi:hypothetical protein